MKLSLDINVAPLGIHLNHGDGIILLGSCFSDSLVPHFENVGFQILSNPLGTIFHPLAISRILKESIGQHTSFNAMNRGDLWFDWRASGMIYGNSEEELNTEIADRFSILRNELSKAKLLVVTLGTAWGYKRYGNIVANCHKMPAENFEKELTSQMELQTEWKQVLDDLRQFNSNLEVVFTVSPVRHVKDGLVENNRSKARLIDLIHSLGNRISYFPSYEIVVDVLRDYRFYKEDLVHPNDQSVKIIWDYFSQFVFNESTRTLNEEVRQVNQMYDHISLYPGSEEDVKFHSKITERQVSLQQKYPQIYWKKKKS